MNAPKVIDSLTHAFDVMMDMLFRPFEFGKWCVLGLVFFLACLPEDFSNLLQIPFQFLEAFTPLLDDDPMAYIAPGLLILSIVLVLVFGLAIVSSIGKFLIFENIQNEEPGVSGRWGKNVSKGLSLFLMNLGFGFLSFFVVVLVLLIGFVAVGFPFADPMSFDPGSLESKIGVIVLCVLLLVLVMIVMGFIVGNISEFVPIIMFTRDCHAGVALREFMGVFGANIGSFLLYMLMKSLVVMGAGIVMQVGTIVTCCLGGLPYVRTTLFLPVLLVLHTYPVAFLGQIRPEYDTILHRFRGDVIPDVHDDPVFDAEELGNGDQTPSDATPSGDAERYRKSWD